ncbi:MULTISPECIES: NAD-dependent epimerase/dehydratase family protein [unclassified Nodularia (in: cyanobacteria)]|uniref:NAD-dependent epimerase/dehydratase family protein n=1 Tax=unclassified Nodularia (in: cyanobacteria) TaxID=2656917 RepID=UPI0018822092|nr:MULTISPECIES: NAD-dependent epimerase/dehydratase family protein [unclassified Nodularia (in: cyanobacteria)]MBE9199404.1 NAD-dependent epimerase/dehydratase family protein [Nodularia sp. LEGE 06071]MCC2692902.1 NAD-dependent epimerase/dehydratase family protein [Nodularia sp. LEGE 04288]
MIILVLGGNGFFGKNIVDTLQQNHHRVFSFSKKDGFDLTNYSLTCEFLSKIQPDVIINCAAKVGSLNYVTKEAADVADINLRMLLNLYKSTQEIVPQAVILNPIANCAYPGNLESYNEADFWQGKVHQSVTAYGNVRRMGVILSECYAMQYELRSINLLVPNMYGSYDSTDPNKAHALNALISKIVKAQKENQANLEVWGSGIAIREWLYVKDCAAIFAKVIERINNYGFAEPLNIAQNFGLSIRELVDIIVNESGFEGQIIWNRNMPDGAPRKVMNDTRFRKVFPDFQFTDLKVGIKETISYYNSVYPY